MHARWNVGAIGRRTDASKFLLEQGAHALWPATLMTVGPYQEPQGAFLPSIAF